MNFDQIRYFVGVAQAGHFGRAARTLGISQSALSHSIAKLEDSLEVRLFERVGRHIVLNNEGRMLLDLASPLLENARSIENQIRSKTGELHGYIRIAAPTALSLAYVGPAWAQMHLKHPKLKAELRSLRSVEIVSRVVASELDIGFCFGPQAHPFLEHRLMGCRKLLVVVRKGHPILKCRHRAEVIQTLASMSAALPMGLLGFGASGSHPFFERNKFRPRIDFLCDNYEVALQYIRSNNAWCLLPDWIINQKKNLITPVRPHDLNEPLEITAIWPKNQKLSAATGLLIDETQRRISRSD